jgi:hypothetical protein
MTVKHFAFSSQMAIPKEPGMLHERRMYSTLFLCPLQYYNRKHLQYFHIYLHGSEFQTNISRHTYTHSYNVKTSYKTMVLLSYIIVVRKPIFLYEVSLLFVVLYLDYTDAMDTNQDPSKKESLHLENFAMTMF